MSTLKSTLALSKTAAEKIKAAIAEGFDGDAIRDIDTTVQAIIEAISDVKGKARRSPAFRALSACVNDYAEVKQAIKSKNLSFADSRMWYVNYHLGEAIKGNARPLREEVEPLVTKFIKEAVGFDAPFSLITDGDFGWAFYVRENDTTSYVNEDLEIEWYGTLLTPVRYLAEEAFEDIQESGDDIGADWEDWDKDAVVEAIEDQFDKNASLEALDYDEIRAAVLEELARRNSDDHSFRS
jgi:hypothetical protein